MSYQIQTKLGEGAYGQVWIGTDLRTGKKVVIKIMDKPEIPNVSFNKVIAREVFIPKILEKKVCHPNISCFLDFVETPNSYQIISEFIPGIDLKKWNLPSNPSILLNIAYELADAFDYIHNLGVAHRDIKPGNIIMRGSHPVVIDFGLSCYRAENGPIDPFEALALCRYSDLQTGTPTYMAPEVVKSAEPFDYFSADVYSLGMVFYYLFNSKTLPVQITSRDPETLYREKIRSYRKSESGTPIDPLINKMLQINPSLRPTMAEVKEELTFMTKATDSFVDWEKTFFVFNSNVRDKFLPAIKSIPEYPSIRENFSFEDIVQTLFSFQQIDDYNYRTKAVPTNTGPDCALIRTWIGENHRLEFWISNKKYAIIWESLGNFLIYGNQNGNVFLIIPDFQYSTYQSFGDIDLPVLNLEEIFELIEDKIRSLFS